MVEDIDLLIRHSVQSAMSKYSRQDKRARWTRLAGQLIWYKDQILRAMTFEALDWDTEKLLQDDYKREQEQQRKQYIQTITPRHISPFIAQKQDEEKEDSEDSKSEHKEESA